jgi:hypothetical protein
MQPKKARNRSAPTPVLKLCVSGHLIATSSIAVPRVDTLMVLMAPQAARVPAGTDEAGDLILPGAEEALASVESISIQGYYLLLAVRGHLLLDLGRTIEAAARFNEGLRCRCSEPERRRLRRGIGECAVRQGAGVANGLPFSTT